MILHLLQIFLTDALTFIIHSFMQCGIGLTAMGSGFLPPCG